MVLERLHKLSRGLGTVNARWKVKDLLQGSKVYSNNCLDMRVKLTENWNKIFFPLILPL